MASYKSKTSLTLTLLISILNGAYSSPHGTKIVLKEGVLEPPILLRCPAFEAVRDKYEGLIAEVLREINQGMLTVDWSKGWWESDSSEKYHYQKLGFVDFVDGKENARLRTNFSRVVERRAETRVLDFALSMSRSDFQGLASFSLSCKVLLVSRTGGTIRQDFDYDVRSAGNDEPSMKFETEADVDVHVEDGAVRVDVTLRNVQSEGDNHHSVVRWKVLSLLGDVLDSSQHSENSVKLVWMDEYCAEKAMITLKPKLAWKQYHRLELVVLAQNYFVLTPQLKLRKNVNVFYAPPKPEFEIKSVGLIKKGAPGSSVIYWVKTGVPLKVECTVKKLGNPESNLQGFSSSNRLRKVTTRDSVKWRGVLLKENIYRDLTFVCQMLSPISNITQSTELNIKITYGPRRVAVTTSPVRAVEGRVLRLACVFEMKPSTRMATWYKSSPGIEATLESEPTAQISFVPSRLNHYETYACEVVNPVTGVSSRSAPFILKVDFEAETHLDASCRIVNETSDARLRLIAACDVARFPPMSLLEFRDRLRLRCPPGFRNEDVKVVVVGDDAAYQTTLGEADRMSRYLVDIAYEPRSCSEDCVVCSVGSLVLIDPFFGDELVSVLLTFNLIKTKALDLDSSDHPQVVVIGASIAVVFLFAVFFAAFVLRRRFSRASPSSLQTSKSFPPHYRSSLIYDWGSDRTSPSNSTSSGSGVVSASDEDFVGDDDCFVVDSTSAEASTAMTTLSAAQDNRRRFPSDPLPNPPWSTNYAEILPRIEGREYVTIADIHMDPGGEAAGYTSEDESQKLADDFRPDFQRAGPTASDFYVNLRVF